MMKKSIILVLLVTMVSCWDIFEEIPEPEFDFPANAEELLIGKWQLTESGGNDVRNEEIFQEFWADSTYWSYHISLTESDSAADATTYEWSLDNEAKLIKIISYIPGDPLFMGIDDNGDSILIPFTLEWALDPIEINLITEEKLVMLRPVFFGGFGGGWGYSKKSLSGSVEETYLKIQ